MQCNNSRVQAMLLFLLGFAWVKAHILLSAMPQGLMVIALSRRVLSAWPCCPPLLSAPNGWGSAAKP
jgi:hypothetical protein